MYLVSQELDTVNEVAVNITGPGEMVCNGSNGATTRVTFLLQHGLLSNMTANVGTLASTAGAPSVSVIAKGQVIPSSLVDVWCGLRLDRWVGARRWLTHEV